MEKITIILARKKPHLHTVTSSSSASDALYQMCCENVDHLIVVDNNKFVGLLTEHDIASKGMFSNKPLHKMVVKEIINTGLPMVTTDDTVERCMKLMRQHNVKYIPVFEDYAFKGVVTADDIIEEAVFNRGRIFDSEKEESAYA